MTALYKLGIINTNIEIELLMPGGTLFTHIEKDNSIIQRGRAFAVFNGTILYKLNSHP